MKAFPLVSLLAAAQMTAGLAQAETYAIDPTHASVVFSANHFGYARTFGFFRTVNGEITFDETNPEASSVSVVIDAASIDTNHDHRDGWLTGENMLDVANNPEITFVSTGIEVTGENTGILTGDLTMGGNTSEVTFDVVFNQLSPNPMSNASTAGFSATGTLTRSDFGLSALVGPIADEVEFMIEVEAVATGG